MADLLDILDRSLRVFIEAGEGLPAEVVLPSDGAWDRLRDELQAISRFGGDCSLPVRLQVHGTEVVCPRILEARKAQAYMEGRDIFIREVLPGAVDEAIRSILEETRNEG